MESSNRQTEQAVLKYFSHEKCAICKVLLPKIKDLLSSEFPLMKLECINIEKDPQTAAQSQVFTAPTIVLMFDEKEYKRYTRNLALSQLANDIRRPYQMLFQ